MQTQLIVSLPLCIFLPEVLICRDELVHLLISTADEVWTETISSCTTVCITGVWRRLATGQEQTGSGLGGRERVWTFDSNTGAGAGEWNTGPELS